jgi:hypothetical protein
MDGGRIVFADALGELHGTVHGVVVTDEPADEANDKDRRLRAGRRSGDGCDRAQQRED